MTGSLTFRLAWQFAALLTLSTVGVLTTGGWLLRYEAIQGLEFMHEVESHELAELLGGDPGITGPELHRRIQQDVNSDASLYFIQVHDDRGTVLFRSANLRNAILPDLTGREMHSTVSLPGIGDTRVSEFHDMPWHIQIASPLSPITRLLTDFVRVSGFLVLGVGLAGLGMGYAFGRVTLRPVRAIERTARRIGADNLRERIPVPAARDELAGLATLLNQMFDRLERSFEHVRRFAADASHELKTPLALIRLNAERLRARVTQDAEAAAGLDDVMEEIARMDRVIESLLFIAKAEGGALSFKLNEHDVSSLLAPFVEDARVLAEDRGVHFELVRDDAGAMRLEPALLRQLLLNLVANALAASSAGGRVTLESARTETGWRFVITDEGPGLPADQHEKVFERFVRHEPTSSQTRGHGLGLAICRSIAEIHHGSIYAQNRPDGRGGLCVVVDLPR